MCRSDATVAIHAKHLNFVQSGLSPIGFSFATSPSRHQRDMKKKRPWKKSHSLSWFSFCSSSNVQSSNFWEKPRCNPPWPFRAGRAPLSPLRSQVTMGLGRSRGQQSFKVWPTSLTGDSELWNLHGTIFFYWWNCRLLPASVVGNVFQFLVQLRNRFDTSPTSQSQPEDSPEDPGCSGCSCPTKMSLVFWPFCRGEIRG